VPAPALGPGGAETSSTNHAAITEDVRRMVARELHDRVAQTLTGMLVDLENFKAQQVEWEDVIRQLDVVQGSTRQVLASLRQLLHDLRGEQSTGDNFMESLGTLITRFEQKTDIVTELEVAPEWPSALTPPAALNLYRIVEEALSNVRWHSGARNVRIALEHRSDSQLVLKVYDDGRGVDMDLPRPAGLGTVGMKERALFLGGHLRIENEPSGGTAVLAVFPREHLVPDKPRLVAPEMATA
jgi:signal transduction histidine kinase